MVRRSQLQPVVGALACRPGFPRPTYADVDPDAKLQAVGKIEDSFDIDMAGICDDNPLSAPVSQPKVPDVTFTIEQLEAMLAQAKRIEEAQ